MREEAHRRRGATAKAVNPEPKRKINDKLTENRRLSTSLCVAKKRHENDRKRIFGEALNEAVKKREAGEACRLSRMLAGRGMGARRDLSPTLAKRHLLNESVTTPEQPIDKAGCNGLRIIFSDESNVTFRRHARCGMCTNLVAHSARSFHPLVSRSCVMHHGDVHYGKVVVPRLVGQEDKRKKHGARPDRSKRLLGTVGHGWLEGRRERRSDSGAAEMSMERGKVGSDFRREAA